MCIIQSEVSQKERHQYSKTTILLSQEWRLRFIQNQDFGVIDNIG